MNIYRCLIPDRIWKVAKFLSVKNKASSKRFFIYMFDPPFSLTYSHICRTPDFLQL